MFVFLNMGHSRINITEGRDVIMKVFVGGSKAINTLDDTAKKILLSLYEKHYDILIGDCYGVDTAVQGYFANFKYSQIKIYASGNNVRNNLGGWSVCNVPVNDGVKGFEFYRQKDIEIANDADYGFMIWDKKSKGTFNNILDLIIWNKKVVLYIPDTGTIIETEEALLDLIEDEWYDEIFKKM